MKKLLTSAAVALALLTGTVAVAQEKGGDTKTSKDKKKAPKKGSEKKKAEQPKAQ